MILKEYRTYFMYNVPYELIVLKKFGIYFSKIIPTNIVTYKTKPPYTLGIWGFSVESGRLELPSKQAIQQLSTRLVFSWIVGTKLAENHLLYPYPHLGFTKTSRPCFGYIYFTGASGANAVNQGLCETS